MLGGIFGSKAKKGAPAKKANPVGDPNCPKCGGKGHYTDGYWGTEEICNCTVSKPEPTYKCKKCKDTKEIFDSYWGSTDPCPYCKEKEEPKPKKCSWCSGTGQVHLGYGEYETCSHCKPDEPKVKTIKLGNTAEALAAKNVPGLMVVPATPKQLQIDYDMEEIPERFEKVLTILRDRFEKGEIKWNKYRSASGKHWHVVIDLPDEISNQERIVWQAIFGSDYMREGLSFMRVIANMEHPTLLFMMPDRVAADSGVVPESAGRKFRQDI